MNYVYFRQPLTDPEPLYWGPVTLIKGQIYRTQKTAMITGFAEERPDRIEILSNVQLLVETKGHLKRLPVLPRR